MAFTKTTNGLVCKRGHVVAKMYEYSSGGRRCMACLQEDLENEKLINARRRRQREHNAKVKNEVLTHYGFHGTLRCSWSGCKVKDIDMLTLDHIHDNGAEHRRKINKADSPAFRGSGMCTYRWVEEHEFPDGFQTLCHNHQWKKQMQKVRRLR